MRRTIALLAVAVCSYAATLQRLSMDEMIGQSSDIVRARVVSSSAAFRGPAASGGMIYTWYKLNVIERLKGRTSTEMQVAVPGGQVGGLRQTIPGAPVLESGRDYVLFIWTSSRGLPQIIGLSQGLFDLRAESDGNLGAHRAVITEPMLDPVSRKQVADRGVELTYKDLKALVLSKVNGGANQ
jgi:hypothetical protein